MVAYHGDGEEEPLDGRVPNVVVVDPDFGNYKPLVESADSGRLHLHFRTRGAEALKLSRRMQVDAWLVAADLDDMAGRDFVEILQGRLGQARLAMVETATPGSARWKDAQRDAGQAGADGILSPPITFRDLEQLLGLPADERAVLFAHASPAVRALDVLPIGASAAAIAIAVLMLG